MTDRSQPSALDYATPVAVRAFSVPRLAIGLVATVFVAIGVGVLAMGVLIASRFQDNSASMIAVGLGFVVVGAGIVGTYFFARTR